MKRSFLLLFLLVCSGCRFSFDRTIGPGEIRGTVVFETTGKAKEPAAGARVVLENSPVSVKTDAQGRFILRGLRSGTYALSITASQGGGVSDSGLRLRNITLAAGPHGQPDGRDLGQVAIGAFGDLAG